jgi:hypothetical protein
VEHPSGVPRTCSMDRHGALSEVSICEYGIAGRQTSILRRMDNTTRVGFQVESERGSEQESEYRPSVDMSGHPSNVRVWA